MKRAVLSGSSAYGLSVVGEDRYRDLNGTYNKKVQGELSDKWFLAR